MKVLLVDFDGTIVDHDFPKIGDPIPGAIETLKELRENGWKLILWTCREDTIVKINGVRTIRKYLTEAVNFCKSHGLEFDAVNEQIPEYDIYNEEANFVRRKPYATYHIDDKNIGGFIGWDKIRELLIDIESVS